MSPQRHGRGEVVYQQSFLQIRRTCSQEGAANRAAAVHAVQGAPGVRNERKLKVTIPAGGSGTHLKLANEGQSGFNGGPAGDLYVVIKVKEHPIFERQGDDLLCINFNVVARWERRSACSPLTGWNKSKSQRAFRLDRASG